MNDFTETVPDELLNMFQESFISGTIMKDILEYIRNLEKVIHIKEGLSKTTFLDPWQDVSIPASRVLATAIGHTKHVCVIGFDENNDFYFASSTPDKMKCLWLCENFRNFLINQAE